MNLDAPHLLWGHNTEVSLDDVARRLSEGPINASADRATMATGFDPLDKVFDGGLRRGDLTIVGGLPGSGKTILALQWARNLARTGRRVLYCCYEHDVATLFGRLLGLEIGELPNPVDIDEREALRDVVRQAISGGWDDEPPGLRHPVVRAALAQMQGYAEHLILTQLAGPTAGLAHIESSVRRSSPNAYDLVVVDYLQKVPSMAVTSAIDRYAATVEGLKTLALVEQCAVVALSAVGPEALSGRRLRLDGLRGAHALAHEADAVLTLNSKLNIVSKSHLAFDSTRHGEFAKAVVLSVEKNRRGEALVDLEFDKDFVNYRFSPRGRFVAEKLIDGVEVAE
jgi:replicative DNA helicase